MTLPIATTEAGIDPDKFVTVGKYIDSVDAHMARGLLESAGIECFLQGENANNLLGAAFARGSWSTSRTRRQPARSLAHPTATSLRTT